MALTNINYANGKKLLLKLAKYRFVETISQTYGMRTRLTRKGLGWWRQYEAIVDGMWYNVKNSVDTNNICYSHTGGLYRMFRLHRNKPVAKISRCTLRLVALPVLLGCCIYLVMVHKLSRMANDNCSVCCNIISFCFYHA